MTSTKKRRGPKREPAAKPEPAQAVDAFLAAEQQEANPEVRRLRKEIDRLRKTIDGYRSGEALIVDAVRQMLEEHPVDLALPPARIPKAPKGASEEIAALHVSDVQYGKRTADFSPTVADARLMLLAEKALKITATRRASARIPTLHLWLGGDLVEGEDIFPGQAHEITQGVLEQSLALAQTLARMVLRLLEGFERVEILSVPGNHGRNGRFGRGQHPKTNWDTLTARLLALMLKGAPAERLSITVAESFYLVDRIYDWGVLLVHGDQIRGGFAGHPWYGSARKAQGWIDAIPEPWDCMVYGHFHTYAAATVNGRYWMCNGTVESSNTYAQEQLAAAGQPCQRLVFFNADHGIISENQVFLTEPGERVPFKRRAEQWLTASPK